MEIDSGLVGAIGIVVTVVIAWFTLRRASQDSKDRSRPYVTVKIVEDVRTSKAFFVVENFGQSAAYGVHIEFGDELSKAEPNISDYGSYIRKMYSRPGLTFGPGQSRRSIYKVMPEKKDSDDVIAPDRLTGTLRYYGPDRRKQYAEALVLDMTGLYYRVDVSGSSSDIERRLKAIAEKIGMLEKPAKSGSQSLSDIHDSLHESASLYDREAQEE
ncbi:hypothetical protein [Brevibacterium linens]|uniref:hypothetical protein n=1 Tax=Brevibacterium linens TaxID=1703 RepID=UPI003BF53219